MDCGVDLVTGATGPVVTIVACSRAMRFDMSDAKTGDKPDISDGSVKSCPGISNELVIERCCDSGKVPVKKKWSSGMLPVAKSGTPDVVERRSAKAVIGKRDVISGVVLINVRMIVGWSDISGLKIGFSAGRSIKLRASPFTVFTRCGPVLNCGPGVIDFPLAILPGNVLIPCAPRTTVGGA